MAKLTHNIEGDLIAAFATYTLVVVIKMMLMSPLTSYFRLTKKVLAQIVNVSYI